MTIYGLIPITRLSSMISRSTDFVRFSHLCYCLFLVRLIIQNQIGHKLMKEGILENCSWTLKTKVYIQNFESLVIHYVQLDPGRSVEWALGVNPVSLFRCKQNVLDLLMELFFMLVKYCLYYIKILIEKYGL